MTMQISPPFGFEEIVLLQRTSGVKLPAADALPGFALVTNAMPVSFVEFAPAHRDYPLVFTSADQGRTFAPVAVLGLANGENLFVREGRWESDVYVPAYVRRYPFCMARVKLGDTEQENRVICIEKSYLADDGERMFDVNGQPTARWTPIEKLLSDYEADLDRTREMCAILSDYQLLEPFAMQAQQTGGEPLNLSGMYRVNEGKLEFLNAAQHKLLFKKGIAGRIYAHLLSLENFGRILARRAMAVPPQRAAG